MPHLPRKAAYTSIGIVAVVGLVHFDPTEGVVKAAIAAVVAMVAGLLAAHTVTDATAIKHGKKL